MDFVFLPGLINLLAHSDYFFLLASGGFLLQIGANIISDTVSRLKKNHQ